MIDDGRLKWFHQHPNISGDYSGGSYKWRQDTALMGRLMWGISLSDRGVSNVVWGEESTRHVPTLSRCEALLFSRLPERQSRGAPRPRLTECCIILWRADRRRAWGVSLGGLRGQLGAGSWHMGWQREPRMLRSPAQVSGMWIVKANSWAQSDSRHRLNSAIAMA